MNPLASTAEQPAPKLGIADRLREAGRLEFSLLGYHGARVQGISRRAGCNVALLYRHWASKKALYLDVLRIALERIGRDVTERLAERPGPAGVIEAYIDAHMRDPCAATLVVRELLDGGPSLQELVERQPSLNDPLRLAARALSSDPGSAEAVSMADVRPIIAAMSIAGMTALVASAHGSARAVMGAPLPPETWRAHLRDLLLNGVAARP